MALQIKKLNQNGFDHMMLMVVVVVVVAVVGTATAVLTHAAAPTTLTTTPVVFKLDGYDVCLTASNVATCTASDREMVYYKPVPKSSNFELKDVAGYCLQDASGKYQTVNGVNNRVWTSLSTPCSSNTKNEQWNWVGSGRNELANVATGNKGCLNAAGASKSSGTPVTVYACNGAWNEIWTEAGVTGVTTN